MWLSSKVFELFQVNKESVAAIREDAAVLRAERDMLKHQLAVTQTNFDWLRMKVNSLESERAALIEVAYKIKLPVPAIERAAPAPDPSFDPRQFTFEDIGDEAAKVLGLPAYSN